MPGKPATLGDWASREQPVQELVASLVMKLLVQRVMKFAHAVFVAVVTGAVLLQGAQAFTVVLTQFQPIFTGHVQSRVFIPIFRGVWKPGWVICLYHAESSSILSTSRR